MNTFECKCHWCNANLIRKRQTAHVELHFCDNRCKAEFQRTKKPVTREWLIEHYINKKLDTTQIGHIVKRDPKSVWNWLKDFMIPTRPRGAGSTRTRLFARGEPSAFTGMKHTEENKRKASERCKAEGRVPYDPAVGSYMKGRKGDQVPSWRGGITPQRQKYYATPEWVIVSRNVWKRDDARCQRCRCRNSGGRRYKFHIHHIVSFECAELRGELANLVLLCVKCHRWVHSSKNTDKLFIKEYHVA